MTWKSVDVGPEALFRDAPPDQVRVTRSDGVQLTIVAPELRAGAIVGTASAGAVLLDNVRLLEVRGVDVWRSVALALPGVIILAFVANQSCGDRC